MKIIDGIKVGKIKRYNDDRGYFQEVYSIESNDNYVQENESFSKKDVIRGLHFQFPKQQAKLVRVIKGKIIDVCVDLRFDSPTFLKYYQLELSSENNFFIYIPTYFAHGFIAMEDTILSYKCTNLYEPNQQYGIKWNDPILNIDWGSINKNDLIISQKDTQLPNLREGLKILYKNKEELWLR